MSDVQVVARRSPAFEEIAVGDELTPLVRGPMTPVHLMRWSAAIENWHRIHYDAPFATGHDGLPALLINGSWKQHFLVQMMREWLGAEGWLAKIGFQFRKMNGAGETLTAWGRVTETREHGGFGLVVCEIGIRNDQGEESTPGTATGVLPLAGGERVPYPFPAGLLDA
jgi:acyl dehydratase